MVAGGDGRLPDGDRLQVGKTLDAQGELFAKFRDVSLWALVVALALGIAGGAWLTRRTLSPIRTLISAVARGRGTGQICRFSRLVAAASNRGHGAERGDRSNIGRFSPGVA